MACRTIAWILSVVAAFIIALTVAQQAAGAYRPAPPELVRAAQRAAPPPKHRVNERRAWIVCRAFRGRLCRPALNVAWCESTLRPTARNGQYRGVFQMGSAERRRFGHGRTVLAQARAARQYHRLSGWRPWECRP